jgi:hypothetical protein
LLVAALAAIILPVSTASAYTQSKNTPHYYGCRAHGSGCQYINFYSQGDVGTGTIYTKYFSSSYSHWPNAFRYDRTFTYYSGRNGYACGTYTAYSSLITQWASLSFQSYTNTITHVY